MLDTHAAKGHHEAVSSQATTRVGGAMGIWESVSNERPDIAEIVNAMRTHINREPEASAEDRLRFLGMERRTARLAAEKGTAPGGIYGAGAWTVGAELLPALFVLPGIAPATPMPLGETQARFLVPDADEFLLHRVVAVPLPPPVEFAGSGFPGTAITVGSRHGTLGALARLDSDVGVLTAGHVAPNVGGLVRNSEGDVVGTVVRSVSRASAPAMSTTADVAFVEIRGRVPMTPQSVQALGAAQTREPVTVWGQSGRMQTWIRGLSPEFLVTADGAAWGDIALTADAVAREGDSGGPAISVEQKLVGHIVGGTPRSYSVIQDIEYQLRAIGAEVA